MIPFQLSLTTGSNENEMMEPEIIHFFKNDHGQHYILNSKVIKTAYETRYMRIPSTLRNNELLPKELNLPLPEMQQFNIESLEWEAIECYSSPLIFAQSDFQRGNAIALNL